MDIHQIIIPLFGVIAIWLANDQRYSMRRFACIFGLLSQPSWLYVTYTAEQWGMFVLAVIFTLSWIRGVNGYWLRLW